MTRTITDAINWGFSFTITDLGKLIGKSPVTLRGWDRLGFINMPRDESGDRKLTTQNISEIADVACDAGRITKQRRDLVHACMILFELVERSNIK